MEARYQRNLGALSAAECRLLGEKRVFLAGCGGLGGFLLEHLVRLGVGHITAVDGDVFEVSNLNRQLLSTAENLGSSKAEAAAARAREVNPGVEVRPVNAFFTAENARELLAGHDLALDALDSGESRRVLERACGELGIPLVHGAIQGWYLQVAVAPPGEGLLAGLYPPGREAVRDKSTLSFVPALCAALQAAEAVKLLCGRESTLWGKLLTGDALEQEYQVLPLTGFSGSGSAK